MIAVHKITICAEEETVLDDVITESHAYCCLVSYLVFAIVVIAYLAQEHPIVCKQVTCLGLYAEVQSVLAVV